MSKRNILIALDGLSSTQLSTSLAASMPALKQFLTERTVVEINCAPFTQAQPTWAQLLTGTNWTENGCTGYVFPNESLAKLEVFTENHLTSPVNLIGDGADSVCINVPLLLPRRRLWLSDGSLPIMQNVSPAKLGQFGSNQYKPRAYSSLRTGLAERLGNAKLIFENERQRLSTSLEILQQSDWTNAIIRVTAFDHLQHLFGWQCFDDSDLIVHRDISTFCNDFDHFLASVSQLANVVILSAFSHSPCRSRFNVNALLRKSGFLNCGTKLNALASVRAEAAGNLTGGSMARSSLRSVGGVLDPQSTVAASPSSGCIFLNLTRAFRDGSIADLAQESQIELELGQFLTDRLHYYFGGRAMIYRPSSAELTQAKREAILPRFILHIPEVEFFDSKESILDNRDKPITCHQASGFILLDKNLTHINAVLTPIEAHSLLRQLGFGVADASHSSQC